MRENVREFNLILGYYLRSGFRAIECFLMKGRTILRAMTLVAACHAAWAAADEPMAIVPFEFFRNAIIVQVKIAGKGPFSMLFDTGVDPSAVDLRLAREIGLPLSAKGEQPSGGGSDVNLAYLTVLPELDLNGLTADKVDSLAVDLSKIGSTLGRSIQGVLGYSFMKNRIFDIDYPRRRLVFHSRSPWSAGFIPQNDARRKFIRFRYKDEILIDGVTVNGKEVTGNIDTGSNSNFQITPKAVETLGLESEVAKAGESGSTGINGKTVNRTGRIKLVSFGGLSAVEPKVVFYGRGTGHDDEAWGIRIGNEFLGNYVVTVDFQNQMICFERP